MKFLKLALALIVSLTISAQEESVINYTYYDIPADKIATF